MSRPHGVYHPVYGIVEPGPEFDPPAETPEQPGPALVPDAAPAAAPAAGSAMGGMIPSEAIKALIAQGHLRKCDFCDKLVPANQQAQPAPTPPVAVHAAAPPDAAPAPAPVDDFDPANDPSLPGADPEDDEAAHGLVDVPGASGESDVPEDDPIHGSVMPGAGQAQGGELRDFTPAEKIQILDRFKAAEDSEHEQQIVQRVGVPRHVLNEWHAERVAGRLVVESL